MINVEVCTNVLPGRRHVCRAGKAGPAPALRRSKKKGSKRVDKEFLHGLTLRGIKVLNAALMTMPFAVCWLLFYASRTAHPFYFWGHVLVFFIFFVIYVTYVRIYEAFRINLSRVNELVYAQGLALIFADAILYIITWLLTLHLPNPLPLLAALAVQLVLAWLWCLGAHGWYAKTVPPQRTAILYGRDEDIQQRIAEYGLNVRFDIRCSLPVDECLHSGFAQLEDIQTVFLYGIHSQERNEILKYCIANRIEVYVLPRIGDVIMSGAIKVHMFHLPLLLVTRYAPNPEYLVMKRALDITLSLAALVLASPVMLVTAIAIKAGDGGPVFYKQTRLTKDGKPFAILKFRSMRVDAESDGVARLSAGDRDDRITKVGRVIRSSRIDELPQLLNVLAGDMSIVGPRPERPEIAAQYEKDLPEFGLRLQARAGLTGYAQVYGKYNSTPYDKLLMDLMYLAKPSIGEDLKIIMATVRILFAPESTEGVAEGQRTAAAPKNVTRPNAPNGTVTENDER